jgi:hypothetical protein
MEKESFKGKNRLVRHNNVSKAPVSPGGKTGNLLGDCPGIHRELHREIELNTPKIAKKSFLRGVFGGFREVFSRFSLGLKNIR